MTAPLLPCDTIVTAQYVLTQAQSEPLTGMGIAVGGGRVLAVNTLAALRDEFQPRETVDFGESILMPGFINAHTHASMTLMRGIADDLPLREWLNDHIFPVERKLDADLVRIGATLACAEMIRFGVTAFADMYLVEEAVFDAVDEAGLRMLGGEAIFQFPSPAYANTDEAFALLRAHAARWKNHPRLHVAVMPHAVYTTNPALLEGCRDLAEELDLPLHIHLAESRSEVEECLKTNGLTPLRYCLERGLITKRTFIAHGVWFDDEELDLLAASGASVVHCPRSNMKLASGVARVPQMLARGINVALGTDGTASSNNLNMTAEMYAAALVHKAKELDPTVLPAHTALAMATANGAKALGWEGLGRIEQGSPADIIAVDLTAPHMQPVHSPVSNLVYAATGTEVRMTMVAGKMLYKDGEFYTLDMTDVRAKAREAVQRLLA